MTERVQGVDLAFKFEPLQDLKGQLTWSQIQVCPLGQEIVMRVGGKGKEKW